MDGGRPSGLNRAGLRGWRRGNRWQDLTDFMDVWASMPGTGPRAGNERQSDLRAVDERSEVRVRGRGSRARTGGARRTPGARGGLRDRVETEAGTVHDRTTGGRGHESTGAGQGGPVVVGDRVSRSGGDTQGAEGVGGRWPDPSGWSRGQRVRGRRRTTTGPGHRKTDSLVATPDQMVIVCSLARPAQISASLTAAWSPSTATPALDPSPADRPDLASRGACALFTGRLGQRCDPHRGAAASLIHHCPVRMRDRSGTRCSSGHRGTSETKSPR